MAGEWIKMRVCLVRDGRVKKMSRSLATNVTHLCGALFFMWSLADELATETSNGGALLVGYDPADLDDYVGVVGFTESLPNDWMEVRDDGLYLPEYTEHNASTGKKRATDQKRQSRKRRQQSDGNATETRLEKRREEKNKETLIPLLLDTPIFHEAWVDWVQHRKEIGKPLKPTTIKSQLKTFEKMGVDAAICQIRNTINQGYQGLWNAKSNKQSDRRKVQSSKEFTEDITIPKL